MAHPELSHCDALLTVLRKFVSPRELNRRLSDLEDAGLLAFRDVPQALLSADHALLEQLVGVMLWTTVEEKGLVELVHHFFQVHGREEELLLWAITHEIAVTDRSPELFRMQSFATQMLFKMFFTDRGYVYLEKTVARVIDTVHDLKEEQLELIPNGVTVSVTEATNNLQFILDVADDLFVLLEEELKYCPSEIRRGFNLMQEVATKKFPEVEDSVVPVCFFLRFLCPTLLQPEQFSLSHSKLTPDATKALLIISKILQNIANGIIKNNITSFQPHDEQVLRFINEHIYTVHDFCVLLADKEGIKADAANVRQLSAGSEKDQEQALDRVYQFIMLGDFRKYLDDQEARQDEREKSYRDHLDKMEQFLTTLETSILAGENQWKLFKTLDGVNFFTSRSTSFWYRVEGTIKASLPQIQASLESIEFDDWTNKIFTDKIIATEKCQVLDHLENLQEEWLLRFKFPFPFGNKSVYVTRTFYAPTNNSFHMLLLPIAGKSKSTLDLTLMFKRHKDESKLCTLNALYALNPEGTFPAQMSASHAKYVFYLFETLIGLLSMDFTVGGKKVEIDYMSQERKESRRILNTMSSAARKDPIKRSDSAETKTDSDNSQNQTHSSSDDSRPLVITKRRRSVSTLDSDGLRKSAEGSGDSSGATTGSSPARANSLSRIKRQRSNPKIQNSFAKSTPPVLSRNSSNEQGPLADEAPKQSRPTRQSIRDTTSLSESPDLWSDEEAQRTNASYLNASEEASQSDLDDLDSDADLLSEVSA